MVMKYLHLLGLIVLLLTKAELACAQVHTTTMYSVPTRENKQDMQQHFGFPAGTVKALIIFVQFQADTINFEGSEWPTGQVPRWASKLISTSMGNYPEKNLSHFYNKISSGKHNLIGDIYPKLVVTQHSDNWYLANKKTLKEINREILQNLDADIDFSKYDNWTTDNTYWNHFVKQEPDEMVDMIFMIYRRVSVEIPARLKFFGSGNSDLWIDTLATNDGVIISGNSGITQHEGAEYIYEWILETAIHEYAHYIYGEHDKFPEFIPSHALEDKPKYRIK